MKGEKSMIIMASTLIKAINECRHIKPEELAKDNIINIDSMQHENQNHETGKKAQKRSNKLI